MPILAGRRANPFSMVGKPLPTSSSAAIDLLALRELMGHVNPETTAAYVHLSPETLAWPDAGSRLKCAEGVSGRPAGPPDMLRSTCGLTQALASRPAVGAAGPAAADVSPLGKGGPRSGPCTTS